MDHDLMDGIIRNENQVHDDSSRGYGGHVPQTLRIVATICSSVANIALQRPITFPDKVYKLSYLEIRDDIDHRHGLEGVWRDDAGKILVAAFIRKIG